MTNPLDLDPVTFLKQKIAYHIAQVKYHDKMANETAAKLHLLAGVENTGEFCQVDDLFDLGVTPDISDNKYSVTYWKPKVEQYLRDVRVHAKTSDIFTALESGTHHTAAERRKIITAISSALYYLVENNKVEKMETSGKGNSYKWIS
jgi:hypothetical protein